jgi:hypothetical protein
MTGLLSQHITWLIFSVGDVCGAVFLEINFRNLLRTYLGQETLATLPIENVDGIVHDFQNGVRKIFDGDEKAYKVSMIGVPEGCCDKIRAGYLRLTALVVDLDVRFFSDRF